jgi:hypothetical protein
MKRLFWGVCYDVVIECQIDAIPWQPVTGDDMSASHVLRENLCRQADAFMATREHPEHVIRLFKNGMLYVGWDISEHALSGFGVREQGHYRSFHNDMRVFLL